MNEILNIKKAKFSSLIHAFRNLGYDISTKIGQNEIRLFLNKRASSGHFDNILIDKLFQVLNIGEKTKIEISSFIEGFLIFDDEITRNAESFKIKLSKEKEIYNKILKQCELYKSEKLNAEGFCKNAKIYGKITDIDIRKKLKGIKEILLLVIFNDKKEELHFKIGDESANLKKSFEFRPTSRKDHFEFIMKGINSRGIEFDIGSKIFPLTEINSQEEYFVQILVPEIDNPNQIAAFINATIVLYMSDYKYYENLRKKQEQILKQYQKAANKANEYLKCVREIYGELTLMKPELIVDLNNEKLMKRNGAKLNVYIENEFEEKSPKRNYFVEYNNEIKINKNSIPLKIEFNNYKQNYGHPVIETKKIEYKYKTNYNYLSKKNNEKKEEEEKNNLNPNNEKENININIINKLPENVKIQKEVRTEEINNIKINSNNNNKDMKNISQDLNNLNIIKEKQKISSLNQQKVNQFDLGTILPNQKIGKLKLTIKEIPIIKNSKYISKSPQKIRTIHRNENSFDLNPFLNKKNIKIEQNKSNEYNINNSKNINNTSKIVKTTLIQNNINKIEAEPKENINLNDKIVENNQNINSEEYERAGVYQMVDDISKKNTLITEAHTLKPIINKVNYNVSVNKAIVNETTSKTLITENILPASYLPEKVNKLIISDQVTYLPLATTKKKITYVTTPPLVHESQVYLGNDNENYFNNSNNFNYGENYINEQNINNMNNNIINYTNNIQNIQGYNNSYINYDNIINNENNYNYNINNPNYYKTVQTSNQIIETKRLPLENNSEFNLQMQQRVRPENQSQQIFYGI